MSFVLYLEVYNVCEIFSEFNVLIYLLVVDVVFNVIFRDFVLFSIYLDLIFNVIS